MLMRTRLEIERVMRDVCRQRGIREIEVSDDELDAFCRSGKPTRSEVYKFVAGKIREENS